MEESLSPVLFTLLGIGAGVALTILYVSLTESIALSRMQRNLILIEVELEYQRQLVEYHKGRVSAFSASYAAVYSAKIGGYITLSGQEENSLKEIVANQRWN